ncbi:MAG: hypothetical protein LDL51_11685 [Chloroflexi bacterium]|nr:hypothetical protein [Chloroflexota bacterium]
MRYGCAGGVKKSPLLQNVCDLSTKQFDSFAFPLAPHPALAARFDEVANSYKFYWLLAILDSARRMPVVHSTSTCQIEPVEALTKQRALT